jgi:predicted glycoside hydrolase/deacetylase ChbG (UPF0249 family)
VAALIGADATVSPVPPRRLIVNADDFGASVGVNRGIIEAHRDGIVTSASLMVDRPRAEQAADLARRNPGLSVGLHFEEHQGASPAADFERQLERFRSLIGRDPTHLDSHHHAHRQAPLREVLARAGDALAVAVRELSPIAYIGGFYAQWEWQVTDLHHVSVEFLQEILHTEVSAEWTELGCHPGYVTDDFQSVYLAEREEEVRTLTDPRVRRTLAELGIELAGFADYARAASV